MAYVKSNITLESIRPYISYTSGNFGVPFTDGGFMWSSEQIEEAKQEYDDYFVKETSKILGITEEEVREKPHKRKSPEASKYWCWKHNLEYKFKTTDCKQPSVGIGINERGTHSIYFQGPFAYKLGYFRIDEKGVIYQDTKHIINSIGDVFRLYKQFERDEINKELDKARASETKTLKSLNTIREKIRTLEGKLNELK